MNNQGHTMWEETMLSEYIARYHAGARVKMHVRLGSVPAAVVPEGADEVLRRAYDNIRLWADRIVIYPERLILMEGKIRPEPGIGSTIELYRDLLPQTPELVPYLDRPVEKELVYTIEYPLIIAWCRQRGIRCVQFYASNFADWLRKATPRQTTGPLPPLPS